jgi:parallel beta-helix repeat protein
MKRGLIRSIFRALVLMALVTVALVAGSQALASTGPMYVTSDTTLTEDHFGSVFITADDVTLDCAGHAVIGGGVGTSVSVGIDVLANGVTVTNCVVRGFLTGVFTAAQGTHVVADTLSENNEGLRLQGATGASILGNTADANAWWGILACCNANGNTISGNSTKLNRIVGMGLNGASWNVFTNNVAAHNERGFGVGFSSDHNTISHNVAANNSVTGFDFLDANDNAIDTNVSVRNGSGPNGGGYAFNNSSRNTVTGNIATNNGSSGFNVFFGSELNLFTANHACRNFFGDAFDSSLGAGNTWIDNHFCNSSLP